MKAWHWYGKMAGATQRWITSRGDPHADIKKNTPVETGELLGKSTLRIAIIHFEESK